MPSNILAPAAAGAMRMSLKRRHADASVLLACLAGTILIRLQLLLSSDFPINDGALFLAFVEAIARVFPALPADMGYNGLSIPFAYPPLSFWLAAGAVRLGAGPLQLMHAAPILMNIGYVLLFTLLLLRTGHGRLFTALAVLVFGTTFLSYEWLVMGGGLSRGLGSLLLLLTLLILLPEAKPTGAAWPSAPLVLGGLGVGAAVLSHLEWGILTACSALICLALPGRGWPAYARAALTVGLVAAAVAAPWLWWVHHTHGLEPFIAASRTSSVRIDAIQTGTLRIARSFNVLVPFMLLGAVTAARTRDVFWVFFIAAALLLTPRSGRTPLMLALGVLTASGMLTSWALLQRWAGPARPAVLAGALGLACILTGLRTSQAMRPEPHFAALPLELREAMAWVSRTHPGGRFAVFKEAPWYYNAAAEWFPVLTGAISTTTVQGREWLPADDFRRAESAVQDFNSAITCNQLLRSLDGFPQADFVWAEGIDLSARAAALTAPPTLVPLEWTQPIQLGPSPAAPSDEPGDAGAPAAAIHPPGLNPQAALRGPGTLAGCFDAAGYEEVHANKRVRIFRIPQPRLPAPPRD